MNIPIFEAVIEYKEDGIQRISLVDLPAVETDFIACSKAKKAKVEFRLDNEEQRIITGPVMRADFPIYRYSEQLGEYYIKYSKETIKEMAEKLMRDQAQNNVNIMHQDGTDVEGVELRQLFIKDIANGISPRGFEEIEDGSLFATYHVTNDRVWSSIKAGEFKGFSLEGYFGLKEVQYNKNLKYKKMNKNKIKELLRSILAQFSTLKTDNGDLEYDADELAEGLEVTIDGEPAADGDYTAEDGTVVTVKDGKIDKIQEPEKKEDDAKEEEKVEAEDVPAEPKPEAPAEGGNTDMDAVKADIETIKKDVDDLKKAIDEIKNQLNQPAAEPVAEEFHKIDKRMEKNNKAISYMRALRG